MSLSVSSRPPVAPLRVKMPVTPSQKPQPASPAPVRVSQQQPSSPMPVGRKFEIGGAIGGVAAMVGGVALGMTVSPVLGSILGFGGLLAGGAAMFFGVMCNNLTT